MPYSKELIVFLLGIAVVFVTFGYLLVNARSLMGLMRPLGEDEIKLGPGRKKASNSKIKWILLLHFAGWAIAAFAWFYLLADVRATAPDTTPLEKAGVVDGGGSKSPAN